MEEFEQWNIKKQEHEWCYWLDFDWCDHEKKKCAYTICPFKIKGSRRIVDTHENVIRKL